jgi:hypothetical protein
VPQDLSLRDHLERTHYMRHRITSGFDKRSTHRARKPRIHPGRNNDGLIAMNRLRDADH